MTYLAITIIACCISFIVGHLLGQEAMHRRVCRILSKEIPS